MMTVIGHHNLASVFGEDSGGSRWHPRVADAIASSSSSSPAHTAEGHKHDTEHTRHKG